MNHGYVPFSREHLHNGMLRNHKLWAFWSWCLLKASYKNHSQVVGNQIINLGPGQFIFGRKKASEELGLTETSLRTIIKNLEKSQNLTIKTTNKFSIITIVNWDSYEAGNWENNQQINQQLTNNQPTTNQQLTTNNKGNNGNKGKKGEGECRGEMTHREQPQTFDGQRLPAVLTKKQLGDHDGNFYGISGEFRGGSADLGDGSEGDQSFSNGDEERIHRRPAHRDSPDVRGEELGIRTSRERVGKPVKYNQGDNDGTHDSDVRANAFEDYGSGKTTGGREVQDCGAGKGKEGSCERMLRGAGEEKKNDIKEISEDFLSGKCWPGDGDQLSGHGGQAERLPGGPREGKDYLHGMQQKYGGGVEEERVEDLGADEGDRFKQKSNKWPERFTQVRREVYPEPGETMRGEGPDDFGAEEGRPGDGSQLSGHGGQVEFLPGGAEEEDLRSGIFPGTIQRRTREVEDNSGPEGSGEVRLGTNERSLPSCSWSDEGVPGGVEEGINSQMGPSGEIRKNLHRSIKIERGTQEEGARESGIGSNERSLQNGSGTVEGVPGKLRICSQEKHGASQRASEEETSGCGLQPGNQPGSLLPDNLTANHLTLHADIKSSNVGGKTALKKPKIEPNEEAVRLATWLADDLLSDDGKHQNLINGKKMPTIMKWAADIDKINRIDKRTWPVIEHVLKEARVHHFWKMNIESGAKLRKQFSRLYLETDGRRAEKKVDQPKKKEPTRSCYDCMGYQTKRCQNITSNMSACGKYATLEEISQVMVTDEPF